MTFTQLSGNYNVIDLSDNVEQDFASLAVDVIPSISSLAFDNLDIAIDPRKLRSIEGMAEDRNISAYIKLVPSRPISVPFFAASKTNNTVESNLSQNTLSHIPGIDESIVHRALSTFSAMVCQFVTFWWLGLLAMLKAASSGSPIWQSSDDRQTFFQWLRRQRIPVRCAMPTTSVPSFSRTYFVKLFSLCVLSCSFQSAFAQSCAAGYVASGVACVLCPVGSYCLGGSSSASACLGSLAQGAAVSAGDS